LCCVPLAWSDGRRGATTPIHWALSPLPWEAPLSESDRLAGAVTCGDRAAGHAWRSKPRITPTTSRHPVKAGNRAGLANCRWLARQGRRTPGFIRPFPPATRPRSDCHRNPEVLQALVAHPRQPGGATCATVPRSTRINGTLSHRAAWPHAHSAIGPASRLSCICVARLSERGYASWFYRDYAYMGGKSFRAMLHASAEHVTIVWESVG